MILRKDPPGYPGDKAVCQEFGRVLRKVRLEAGITTDQAEILLHEALTPSNSAHKNMQFGKALGIFVRRIRERNGMTRIQLASNSGLPLRFIISVERRKVTTGGNLCQLTRLAYGLRYPVDQFFNELTDLNEELAGSAQ